MARRKAKSSSVKVNFKGVESRSTPAEGDYPFKVLEATSGKSSAGNEQIEVIAEVTKGENKGFKGYLYFPLQENSLWKLHAFLTALGEEVPEDEMDIDLSELVDREFVGVLTHETYNGRKRAKLTDFDTIDNYEGGDDEKPAKGGKKGAGKKGKSEPEKVSRSDVEEMDEDELQELLEKHDLEDEVDLDDIKKLPKKQAAVIEALEEADLLADDDDDEPEEKPAKGKKGKSKKDADEDEDEDEGKSSKKSKKGKAPKKYDRDDIEEMDVKALAKVVKESGIDVDLDDYKKVGKARDAVIEALDDEDLLED